MCLCPIALAKTVEPFLSCRISSIFPFISTPKKPISKNGSSIASCGCVRPRFAILRPISRKYADLDDTAAEATARDIWTKINLKNLRESVFPTMPRASLILTKGSNHVIEEVELRKL